MHNLTNKVKPGLKIANPPSRPFGVISITVAAMNIGMLQTTANAQEQQVHDDFETVETIAVYGAKNAKTLKDNLTSIGIVFADDIKEKELRSFRDAFRTLGNVMDSGWTDSGFIIRGVNSEGLTPGGSALATLYIDGAAQTSNGARRGARGLWDVEQIEVYRGPQSTISGRASLAGAIYIKTKDPTFEWDLKSKATIGNLKTKAGALAFGGPLVEDQLAFRVAAEYSKSRNDINYPMFERFERFDEFVEDEYYQIRGKLLLTPAGMSDTMAVLSYSFSHDSPHLDDIAGPLAGFTLSGLTYDDKRGEVNAPIFTETRTGETQNISLNIAHDFSSAFSLTAVSSFSDSDMRKPSVNEGTPGEILVTRGGVDQRLFTQEVRFNYTGDNLDAVFGLYFADENTETETSRQNTPTVLDHTTTSHDVSNYAAFGEITYEFAPSWKIIVGGRADENRQDIGLTAGQNGTLLLDATNAVSEFNFLPKFALMKDIGNDHTVGASVQRGFRSGGAGVSFSTGQAFEFDAEYTWTYELSYKGSLVDGRLNVTANVFYTDWSDQQVEALANPLDFTSGFTTNAASSSLYGFELEGHFSVSSELSLFTSVGHVITEFDEFIDLSLGTLTGLPFPGSAKWNMAFGGTYEHRSGFHAGADVSYVSSYLSPFGILPHDYVDGHWISNARIGYRTDKWEVALFVENLFANDYFVYNDFGDFTPFGFPIQDDIAGTLGARRFIGVTVGVNF